VAKDFLDDAINRNNSAPHTIHADRGGAMVSKPPNRSEPSDRSPQPMPTPSTPNASRADPGHPNYPRSPGSTNPLTSHNQPRKHSLSHLT
jgi:hypothetical protein